VTFWEFFAVGFVGGFYGAALVAACFVFRPWGWLFTLVNVLAVVAWMWLPVLRAE